MNDFFAEIEEVFGSVYLNAFSDELYNNQVYNLLGFSLFGFSLLWMITYYYVINHPKYSTRLWWAIWTIIGGLITAVISYIISFNALSEIYFNNQKVLPYLNEFYTLSIINLFWSVILSFLFSIFLRLKSTNASHTPF